MASSLRILIAFGSLGISAGRGVSGGTSHVCSLREKDKTAVCWGWDAGGQISKAPKDEKFLHIAAGVRHNCGIREADGKISCWGQAFSGEIDPPAGDTFKEVVGGYWHMCGHENDNTVKCWGSTTHGQINVPAGMKFLAVDVGASHTCGIELDSRKPVCWGNKKSGGDPPVNEDKFKTISAGEYHSCGIREDETVTCWGLDHYEQSSIPYPLQQEKFLEVVAGGDHSCAILKRDRSITCWGLDKDGQATPPKGGGYEYLIAGVYYTCGVHKHRSLQCFGRNAEKQLDVPRDHSVEL